MSRNESAAVKAEEQVQTEPGAQLGALVAPSASAAAAAAESAAPRSANSRAATASSSSPVGAAAPAAAAQLEPSPGHGGGRVTVEDEPQRKCCSVCLRDLPPSDFSGAQLKKKAKRVCKGCVERREAAAAKEAEEAADAAKAASTSPPCAASSSAAAPPATAAASRSCVVCGKGGATKLRQCSRCHSHYCGLACLKQHSSAESQQCEAIRTLPPLSIADEDRLTTADVEQLWPRIRDSAHQLALSHPNSSTAAIVQTAVDAQGLDVTSDDLSAVAGLYPPSPAEPWWLDGSTGRRVAGLMQQFGEPFSRAIISMNDLHMALVTDVLRSPCTAAQARGLIYRSAASVHTPAVQDQSRLFHRLLRHWIYYFRHVDPKLIDSTERPFVDVQSDHQGVLPVSLRGENCDTAVAYCSEVDERGRLTVLPANILCLPNAPLRKASVSLRGHIRHIILRDNRIVEEPGLVCGHGAGIMLLQAVSGRAPHPNDSFLEAPVQCFYAETSMVQEWTNRKQLDHYSREDARRELEAREKPGYFHLTAAMRDALGDEWPKLNDFIFIATPRSGVETELSELLLLESLAEEAAAGDSHAQLLLAHAEAECGGAPIAEVIAAQRSKVEAMLAHQKEQLRLHAEAVQRHDERSRLRLQGRAGQGSGSGISGVGLSAPSSATGPASSSSVAKLSAPMSELSLPSSFSSVTSSVSSATALSSADRAAITASAASAACSWTAAHSSLESLRAPGRQKYGPIMKVALRFLRSLQPKSVNRGGGSHLVFHFGAGSPVTLVQPHGGGRSKDATKGAGYCTRLYHSLHQAALQQMQLVGGGGAEPAAALPAASGSI